MILEIVIGSDQPQNVVDTKYGNRNGIEHVKHYVRFPYHQWNGAENDNDNHEDIINTAQRAFFDARFQDFVYFFFSNYSYRLPADESIIAYDTAAREVRCVSSQDVL